MKKSDIIFTAIMGLGMSIIMTLVITFINTGMDNEYLNRWFKAWLAGFPIAVLAAAVMAPIAKKNNEKIYILNCIS